MNTGSSGSSIGASFFWAPPEFLVLGSIVFPVFLVSLFNKNVAYTAKLKMSPKNHEKGVVSRSRARFGTWEVSVASGTPGVPTPVDLYTPEQAAGAHHEAGAVIDRITCPSGANCNDKIDSDLFGVSDLSVARVGAVSELEQEFRAYEVMRLVAGGFRTVTAQLVMPSSPKFDPPHLLIERYTPLSRYASQITDGSVWDLAALLDRMHRSGVAHGYIREGSVGVVQDTSGPWFWRTKGQQRLVLGSPRYIVVSPLSESGKQPKSPLERAVVAALRDALKGDPRGLRVRIKQEGALVGLSGAQRETGSVIAAHNAAVDVMESDIRQLLALFQSKLDSPREEAGEAKARESARVWASLVPVAGKVAVGEKTKESASKNEENRKLVAAELDVAEDLVSQTTGALAIALIQEIGAIRTALSSPHEVPEGLWPRTRNVVRSTLDAIAKARDHGEQARIDSREEKAAAERLGALITELLDNDRDVKEFRELFRIERDSAYASNGGGEAEKSIVDEWHVLLGEIRRSGNPVRRLRGLYSDIRRWTGVSAKAEIKKLKESLRVNFESGVNVDEFLVVHFNRTSAYSSDEKATIRGSCAEATKKLDELNPNMTGPLKTKEWKPINVFVSRQLPDTDGGCDNSLIAGMAHSIGSIGSVTCPHHPYKIDSIQVRASDRMEDVPRTVLHELIHALHFRNEHARWAEGDYKRAISGLRDLLATYQRSIKERGTYDWYASTDIYEFLVGVVQVLTGENARLPKLSAFVEQNNQEIKSHAFGILTAKK